MATVEELLSPIPGPNPSGENIRYTTAYDKLKEARRAGGDWLSESGTIDYAIVIKQCEDMLLKKSKDLQIAAWLLDAWIVKQGFTGFHNGMLLIKGLIENFWDTLHPELEDGDTGLRLAPLDWIGSYLDVPLKKVPLTKGAGYSLLQYKESQMIGMPPPDTDEARYEDGWQQKKEAYDSAIKDGKIGGDMFDAAFQKTPKEYYVELAARLVSILELLEAMNVIGEEKFPEEPPSFSKVRVTLEEVQITVNSLLQEKRKLEPDAGEEQAEEEAGEENLENAEEGTSEEVVTVARVKKKKSKSVTGIEPENEEDAADRISAVASWLRAQNPQNPAPYLMLRGYRWGELRATAGNTAPDQVLLEAPSTEVRTQLKKLWLEAQYEEMIRIGEEAMATPAGRGWLDLQRYMVGACDNLYWHASSGAIKSALKSLLTDLPDMLGMTLMDDTPVANAETQQWIKDNVLPPPPEPVQEVQTYYQPEPEPEPEPVSYYQAPQEDQQPAEQRAPDAFELAQEALRAGNKEQAVEILVREMSSERSGRARFHRKMQLAQICLSIGRQMVARPILEELASEIEKRRLDEWEPADMVAHTLALLYRCMDDNERKQQIYAWICRLDPMQAIAVAK